jgi:hypothetical protein
MTDEEMHKIAKLQALFMRSKELDREAATQMLILTDQLIEALARGNTRAVEKGLAVMRGCFAEQAGHGG